MNISGSSFYIRQGEQLVPTGLGASVWDETKQGGAPVVALCAQLLAATPATAPMIPARMTFDILGAVPMAPLLPRIRVVRDGKRIQLLAIELEALNHICVAGTMLRVRSEGQEECNEPLTRPFPEGAQGIRRTIGESIRIEGDERTPGPGALWMRVITPIIEGEMTSVLARTAAAADWASSVAPPADPDLWTYASVDLSINLSRLPVSDWMLLDGRSEVAGNGAGYAAMRMGDRSGMFGTVTQSMYLSRR